MRNGISIVILTFNSALSVERTIRSLHPLSDDIHVVDSFSTDNTAKICTDLGCQVVQHKFDDYASQRNWAIENLSLRYPWQLHVDADEEFTSDLVQKIIDLDLHNGGVDGYIIGRKLVFMGKILRFGAISKTWHYRLFRNGFGRCEDRLYDQHFVNLGSIRRINAFMLDHQENSLSEWTVRHNRWSDMEVEEILNPRHDKSGAILVPNLHGSPIELKRAIKVRYYKMPLFIRSVSYFIYSYFIKLGFLDGRRGFIFNVLQAFWFRVLVDAKIFEAQVAAKGGESRPIGGR